MSTSFSGHLWEESTKLQSVTAVQPKWQRELDRITRSYSTVCTSAIRFMFPTATFNGRTRIHASVSCCADLCAEWCSGNLLSGSVRELSVQNGEAPWTRILTPWIRLNRQPGALQPTYILVMLVIPVARKTGITDQPGSQTFFT